MVERQCLARSTIGKSCTLQSIVDKAARESKQARATDVVVANVCPVKEKRPLTTAVNGRLQERETGFEPATSSLGSNNVTVTSGDSEEVTSTPSDACTCACTSKAENANAAPSTPGEDRDAASCQKQADPLTTIAKAIAGLSTADREQLEAILKTKEA